MTSYQLFQQEHYGNILPETKSLRTEEEQYEDMDRFEEFIHAQPEPELIEND